jgi:hypothetical protein
MTPAEAEAARKRNPKAFAFASGGRAERMARRQLDVQVCEHG